MSDDNIEWPAPGPGQWAHDGSHLPPGTTPLMQSIIAPAMTDGQRRVFRELGIPMDTITTAFINGHMYTRLRPLIRPDNPSTRLPPLPLLKLAVRVHPEMRRRNATAGRVAAASPSPAVIEKWHNGMREAIVGRTRQLLDVDLSAASDDALLGEIGKRLDHCATQMEEHFWLHGYDLGPLGVYLHEGEQMGVDADTLLSLLEGASPSTSAPTKTLVAIRRLVEAAGAVPTSLDEVRALGPEAAALVDAYLADHGHVLFSRYDFDGVTLAERPDLVVASIMNAEHVDTADAVRQRTERARSMVPEAHRARFDALLGDARAAMDLRDDNGPVTAEGPVGILRYALVELGSRLAAQGRLHDSQHVFELHRAELAPAVFDGIPSADDLAERARVRARQRTLVPPAQVGVTEVAPPPTVLPSHLRNGVGTVETVLRHLGMAGATRADPLSGSGVGTTSVIGTARLAANPEAAFDVLEPGDILVVAGTTPAYNLVVSIAGGLVTADGGPMSHAAVIARELGIPAVVGARGALTDIPDGATIEVDPVAGCVRVVAVP